MDKGTDVQTAEMIFRMAFRLFLEKGYEATNVREIGMAAGINASTIYFYHASKKELFLNVLDRVLKNELEELRSIECQLPHSMGVETVRCLFYGRIETFFGDSASYRFLLRYLLFPVTELGEEIRKTYMKYQKQEYAVWEKHIAAYLGEGGTEATKKILYRKIKQILDGMMNEMIYSGQTMSQEVIGTYWTRFLEESLVN